MCNVGVLVRQSEDIAACIDLNRAMDILKKKY